MEGTYANAIKKIAEIACPYLIAEIQAAAGYLGKPITLQMLMQLESLTERELTAEAQLVREAVLLRQTVENGEFIRKQMERERGQQEASKGLLS